MSRTEGPLKFHAKQMHFLVNIIHYCEQALI